MAVRGLDGTPRWWRRLGKEEGGDRARGPHPCGLRRSLRRSSSLSVPGRAGGCAGQHRHGPLESRRPDLAKEARAAAAEQGEKGRRRVQERGQRRRFHARLPPRLPPPSSPASYLEDVPPRSRDRRGSGGRGSSRRERAVGLRVMKKGERRAQIPRDSPKP